MSIQSFNPCSNWIQSLVSFFLELTTWIESQCIKYDEKRMPTKQQKT